MLVKLRNWLAGLLKGKELASRALSKDPVVRLLKKLHRLKDYEREHWVKTLLEYGCSDPDCPVDDATDGLRLARVWDYRLDRMGKECEIVQSALRKAFRDICSNYNPARDKPKLGCEILWLLESYPMASAFLTKMIRDHGAMRRSYLGHNVYLEAARIIPKIIHDWRLLKPWIERDARIEVTEDRHITVAALKVWASWGSLDNDLGAFAHRAACYIISDPDVNELELLPVLEAAKGNPSYDAKSFLSQVLHSVLRDIPGSAPKWCNLVKPAFGGQMASSFTRDALGMWGRWADLRTELIDFVRQASSLLDSDAEENGKAVSSMLGSAKKNDSFVLQDFIPQVAVSVRSDFPATGGIWSGIIVKTLGRRAFSIFKREMGASFQPEWN